MVSEDVMVDDRTRRCAMDRRRVEDMDRRLELKLLMNENRGRDGVHAAERVPRQEDLLAAPRLEIRHELEDLRTRRRSWLYQLLTTHHSPPPTHHSPLTTHY